MLYALLAREPALLWPALGVATFGNTLGGMSSFLIGWLLPRRLTSAREVAWLRRYGSPVLLLSWVPVIGDALCVAAGWLRLHAGWAAFYLALGKLARYWLVAQAVGRL